MNPPSGEARAALRERARRLGMPQDAVLLLVEAEAHRLVVDEAGGAEPPAVFPVSTAKAGLGEQVDSQQTPRGFHRVADRIGAGAPAGTVFVSRVPSGVVLPPAVWADSEGDRILSRILRLAGCEAGDNAGGACDTWERMIYLHGTNHEREVGRAACSHGCIRMRNEDIISLFDRFSGREVWVWVGTHVPRL
jgi:lipoprotein-anchoring transpeptidase ErfK/SrfK